MESFVTAADMSHDHRVLLTSWFLPIYCGLHLSAIVLLMFYRIQKDTHEQNLATLAERKTVSDVSASVPVAPI